MKRQVIGLQMCFFCSVTLALSCTLPIPLTVTVWTLYLPTTVSHVSLHLAFLSSVFYSLFSFLNRMSLMSLSFLSLPSSPSLTPGSSPDSWQTTPPVWLQCGVCFFFFLYLFSACNVHTCVHTCIHRRTHKLPVLVPQHSSVLSACQSLFGDPKEFLRGFEK